MASLTRQLSIDASSADVPFGANDQPARAILRGRFSDWRQQAWSAVAAEGLVAPFPLRSGLACRRGFGEGELATRSVTGL